MDNFDGATIEINNWDKYNPRKDLKATSWVRLQNSLFEDPNFIEFNHAELLFWVYLLSMASKKQSGTVKLSLPHAIRIGRFTERDVHEAIKKLIDIECVRICEAGRTQTLRARDVHDTLRTNAPTTNETYVTNELAPSSANSDATSEDPEPKALLNPEGPSPTALTWRAYRDAYEERHGKAPPWNAKIGGQLKQLVSRIPAEEAPLVAAFYLTHNDAYYVKSMHPVGLLLRDAEKLRTEWATGKKMTGIQAKSAEQKDANVQAMKDYLASKGTHPQ